MLDHQPIAKVRGTVFDKSHAGNAARCELRFRPSGKGAVADWSPTLAAGATSVKTGLPESWLNRFQFLSDDGSLEVWASGCGDVLGLRFAVPIEKVFAVDLSCGAGRLKS